MLSESVLLGSSRVRIQSLYPQSKSNREVPSSNRQFLTVKNRQPDKGKETETCLTRYNYLTERSQMGIKWRMYILFVNPTRLSNRCDFFFHLHWIWSALLKWSAKNKGNVYFYPYTICRITLFYNVIPYFFMLLNNKHFQWSLFITLTDFNLLFCFHRSGHSTIISKEIIDFVIIFTFDCKITIICAYLSLYTPDLIYCNHINIFV